jgi:hypothetical protein
MIKKHFFFGFVGHKCSSESLFGPYHERVLNPACPCADWLCVPLRTLAFCIAHVLSSLLFGSSVSHFTTPFVDHSLHPPSISVWAFSLLFCLLTGFTDSLSHSCFFHSVHMSSHCRPFCFNPLPLIFKALLHGQKGCIFFSGHLNT